MKRYWKLDFLVDLQYVNGRPVSDKALEWSQANQIIVRDTRAIDLLNFLVSNSR